MTEVLAKVENDLVNLGLSKVGIKGLIVKPHSSVIGPPSRFPLVNRQSTACEQSDPSVRSQKPKLRDPEPNTLTIPKHLSQRYVSYKLWYNAASTRKHCSP